MRKWEILPVAVTEPPQSRLKGAALHSRRDLNTSLSSDQRAAVLDRMRQEEGRADALFNSPIFEEGDGGGEDNENGGLIDRRLYPESSSCSDAESLTADDDVALAQFLSEHMDD
jgi:hypothetical protein